MGMTVTILQTCDPVKYIPIISATERVNRLYAKLHGYEYKVYKQIFKGRSAVHAAFNRVFIIFNMMKAGYSGWVAYLDADAFFADIYFDLSCYLKDNSSHSFIAAKASTDPRKWAINNGVFFLNLGHPLGQKLIDKYMFSVGKLVPDWYWALDDAPWPPQEFDDQNILFSVLANDPEILENIKNEEGVFNTAYGAAIKQLLRASFSSFQERVSAIDAACDETINRFVADINPLLSRQI